MNHLLQHGTRATPQSAPIPGSTQVPNHAGGYAFAVDDWTRLDRFLVLGSEGGTYYVGERKLTADSAAAALRCVKADGVRTVARVVEISNAGRAPKNDPALFVLAMATAHGDEATRRAAYDALPKVARIGTHLFHFLAMRETFGGWGRGMRSAVARWYTAKAPDSLAYQVVKYRQRDGWSHRDALRLSHPKAPAGALGEVLAFAAGKGGPEYTVRLLEGFRLAQAAPSPKATAALVREYNLPREALLTEHLNDRDVWAALLESMPVMAMIRNLATMTRIGLLSPMSDAVAKVVAELASAERIAKARVHPIAVLAALKTYASGQGVRGANSWTPVPQIVDALDEAFYTSFGNVEPTGKRVMLGLDVSGSMSGTRVNGIDGLSAREACGAMALITSKVEARHAVVCFDTSIHTPALSAKQRLDDVVKVLSRTGGGGTDCALPILYAADRNIGVDLFVIYTDSETWQGRIHPTQAMRAYREKTGIPARLAVVAMAATSTSIADPQDAGQMNVVGFDTATPDLITQFAVQ